MNRIEKLCNKCQEVRQHSVRASGAPYAWCLECQKDYSRQHYKKNKKAHNERRYAHAKESRKEVHRMITELKNVPCADCSGRFPKEVMEFDHVRGEKLFTISDFVHRIGVEKLLDEVAKCDVVCANCHRMRTFYGLGWQSQRLNTISSFKDDEEV